MKVIDASKLSTEHQALLRPGGVMRDSTGGEQQLPRFFYEVESWAEAKAMQLTAHFTLAELITVDCGEADLLLREFPHYVPCAVSLLARYLEEFRTRAEGPVFVSVNGGYRSPAHRRSGDTASSHHWAVAADIYRVGDTWLDSQKAIERYGKVAESIGQEIFVKPFGHAQGETDDHLHIDLGFATLVPRR
jgi:hypothetical protein